MWESEKEILLQRTSLFSFIFTNTNFPEKTNLMTKHKFYSHKRHETMFSRVLGVRSADIWL